MNVILCGGGTAGCFAAIAAARQGANTLLIERSFTVGGMLTVGEAGITKFTEHCKAVDRYKKRYWTFSEPIRKRCRWSAE